MYTLIRHIFIYATILEFITPRPFCSHGFSRAFLRRFRGRRAHSIKFTLLNLAGAIFQVRMHPGATGDERLSTGNGIMERDMGHSAKLYVLLKLEDIRLFGEQLNFSVDFFQW